MTRTSFMRASFMQVVCAAAMLAAGPALAQSDMPAMSGHKMHHMAKTGHHGMKAQKTAVYGDAAVNHLNDQSLKAAQQGQAFDAGAPVAPAAAKGGAAKM
jgi:hypothetical protein